MTFLEFNSDGTLKKPEKSQKEDDLDYLYILDALQEIPFPIGKTTLAEFLQGRIFNKTVSKHHLDRLKTFGTLKHEKEKVESMIENLIANGLLQLKGTEDNKFHKVLFVTKKGEAELQSPALYTKKFSPSFHHSETIITEKEREVFKALDYFLHSYNDEQKKAIISSNEKILCIAGAGSGKTTALVKRIEFLVRYKSVPSEKILAITFTRKAKQEMSSRLSQLNISDIKVETFNSFCESFLRHSSLPFNFSKRVMTYGDKIAVIKKALESINQTLNSALNKYFSNSQMKNKTQEELANIFMNDCFSIIDYYKSRNEILQDFSSKAEIDQKEAARMVFQICKFLEEYMKKNSLRDFTDQIVDTINIFKSNPQLKPKFEHILVDEYQDVNSLQVELLDLLNVRNLFCVGDPRQSIFGWRGSDIGYILNFQEKHKDCEVIYLTKNYRSQKQLVELINASIKDMKLPDLEHTSKGDTKINLHSFDSEYEELEFVIKKIQESSDPKNEIFVIARTNRQLKELSALMKSREIKHIVRTDEIRTTITAEKDDVTLSTVHAIKGLEAKTVFLIGCTPLNFPCKASDHPVIELLKMNEYDKEEEEKRLFYVAMSRAKEKLFLTYSGKKPTYFINENMKQIIQSKTSDMDIFSKRIQ